MPTPPTLSSITVALLSANENPPAITVSQMLKAFESESAAGLSFLKPIPRNPVEPPSITDISIHVDIPFGSWMPWSRMNFLFLQTRDSKELLLSLLPSLKSNISHLDGILTTTPLTSEEQAILGKTISDKILSPSAAAAVIASTLPNQRAALRTLPPILSPEECPPISIVTLTYNRRKFLDLAFHNLMITDYPKDKIEWVIIEDSDIQEEQASDKIMKFARSAAPMSVSYIPCDKKKPIGEKRNEAISRAQHDIILMMDDDDHYPETSFRRRVAWLLKHPWKPQATVCTTIACYDLLKGTSSVNIPPFTLPACQRISEATLTFYKSWWQARSFPAESNMAEGEGFIAGRESEILEIPPQHILVAMTHGKNVSSRRAPSTDAKPSCFWGFPKEFLIFLHGLAGVQVEEDTSTPSSKPKRSQR